MTIYKGFLKSILLNVEIFLFYYNVILKNVIFLKYFKYLLHATYGVRCRRSNFGLKIIGYSILI